MADFEIRYNGIPFKVKGVDSEEEARIRVGKAATANPTFLQDKALDLGMHYDQETQTGRERSGVNKFLIGAGKSFHDIGDFIEEAALEGSGQFEKLDELRQRIADNEESFDNIDSREDGFFGTTIGAEDVGQSVNDIVLSLGGGMAATKTALAAWRLLSPFGWGKNAIKRFIKKSLKKGLDEKAIAASVSTEAGQTAVKTLSKVKEPTEKVIDSIVNQVKKGADEFAPGANMRVRDAQVRAARQLRGQQPRAELTEQAAKAQDDTAAAVAQRVAERRAQSVEKGKELQFSRSAATRSSQQNQRNVQKNELRDLIRQKNTQGPSGSTNVPKPNAPINQAPKKQQVFPEPQVKQAPIPQPKEPIKIKVNDKTPKAPPAQPKNPPNVATKAAQKGKDASFAERMRVAEKREARLLAAEEAFSKLKIKDAGKTTFTNSQTRASRLR